MSIINNVLKDLESRSSPFTPIGIASVDPAAATPSRSSVPVTLAVLLLVMLGLAVWFYQVSQQSGVVVADTGSSVTLSEQSPAIKTIATPEPSPIVAVPEPVNQLIGMQVRESNEAISLEFSLREKVVSYLKARSEDGIIYHLKDIQSEIVAPVISDNRWIRQLAMTAESDGLDINLTTLTGVLVETRQQQRGDEVIWAITLSKLPDPVEIQPVIVTPTSQPIQPASSELTEQSNPSPLGDDAPIQIDTALVKLEIKSRDSDGDAMRQFKKAQTLIKQRRYGQAETLLRGLLDSTEDIAARESLMLIYKRDKTPARLNELVQASLSRYPNHALFQTRQAESLFNRKAYQQVIDFLQTQSNPDYMQLALIAASFQRLDQHQPAADFYRQSLQVDASQAKSWIALGLSEEHNGNLQQALTAYRSASRQAGLNEKLTQFVEQRSKILEQVIN